MRVVAVAILTLLSSGVARAQETQIPDWLELYFSTEARGPKFGHAWLERADEVRRLQAAADLLPKPPPGRLALSGVFRMAVLAGTFTDVVPAFTTSQYQEAFFAAQGTGGFYTLSQYFEEVSGGLFTFAGAVTPWIQVDSNRAYYIDNFSNHGRGRYQEYIREVLQHADTIVDWRQYDNDGPDGLPDSGDDDGFVDMVAFLYPLTPGGCGASPSAGGFIPTGWRLEYLSVFERQPFTTSRVGADGQPLKVDDFILSAGLDCPPDRISPMNVNIHEMGHALGLPDLYDLDYSSYGVGVWDVMGYGVYAAQGRPAHLGAWTRRQLGWAEMTSVTSSGQLVLDPVETSRAVALIHIPNIVGEYFMLENRQRLLADAGLPGTGLLLWHIDEAVLNLNSYRAADDETRPGIAVLQADGLRDLVHKSNWGDAGDPFPGSSANHTVTDASQPSTRSNLGARSGIRLLAITETDDVVTLDVILGALVDAVFVSPEVAVDLPNTNLQLSVRLEGPDGETVTGVPVEWASSIPSVATVTNAGLVTGLGRGTTAITAVSQGIVGSASISFASVNDVLASITGGATLNQSAKEALDVLGNANGWFDIGDVVLYWARVQATAGVSP